MCQHLPGCPGADAPDRDAARVVAPHPEQGWSLLCNGVVIFDDTGELLPDGHALDPHGRCCPDLLDPDLLDPDLLDPQPAHAA